MLRSKYVATFFVCALVVGAYAPRASAHDNPGAVTIHVTEAGFTPHSVTVTPGTTVTFENAGTENHWPAADDHPSHTRYDGTTLDVHCASTSTRVSFDACRAIEPGQHWSFTFDRDGVYEYHDHLWPQLVGAVTVRAADQADTTQWRFMRSIRAVIARVCAFLFGAASTVSSPPPAPLATGDTQDAVYQELKATYVAFLARSDPSITIAALREAATHDDRVSSFCHDILHEVGRRSYVTYGGLVGALHYQTDFCNSGYVHGVFESYFLSGTVSAPDIVQHCTAYAAVHSRKFDAWQCYHGVGHGFMYMTGGDLDTSLRLCEETVGVADVASCTNGVYMEVFNGEPLAKEARFVDRTHPFATCAAHDVARADCYFYAPTALLQAPGAHFDDALATCTTVPSEYRTFCAQGVGGEAIKRNAHNHTAVFALCDHATPALRDACVAGIVSTHVFQEGSYAAGEQMCSRAPRGYQSACDEGLRAQESFFN